MGDLTQRFDTPSVLQDEDSWSMWGAKDSPWSWGRETSAGNHMLSETSFIPLEHIQVAGAGFSGSLGACPSD